MDSQRLNEQYAAYLAKQSGDARRRTIIVAEVTCECGEQIYWHPHVGTDHQCSDQPGESHASSD